MLLLLIQMLLGCGLNEVGPATPGSPSAEHAAKAARLASLATEVEAAAKAVEVQTDEARRRIEAGETTPEEEAARLSALTATVSEKNEALQAEVAAWEAEIPKLAGDPRATPRPPAAALPPGSGAP